MTDEDLEQVNGGATGPKVEGVIGSASAAGIIFKIEQYGNNVSGGQKQRLAIARTFAECFNMIDYNSHGD